MALQSEVRDAGWGPHPVHIRGQRLRAAACSSDSDNCLEHGRVAGLQSLRVLSGKWTMRASKARKRFSVPASERRVAQQGRGKVAVRQSPGRDRRSSFEPSSIQAISSARFGSMISFLRPHSHTTATRQPAARSASIFRASRSTFWQNFSCQNSGRVAGVVAYLQPA